MNEVMTYEGAPVRAKEGLVTERGNRPITPLPVFCAMTNWGFRCESENTALAPEE